MPTVISAYSPPSSGMPPMKAMSQKLESSIHAIGPLR
jgi:hypothetical protein